MSDPTCPSRAWQPNRAGVLVRAYGPVPEQRTARGRLVVAGLPARVSIVGPVGGRWVTEVPGELGLLSWSLLEAADWLRAEEAMARVEMNKENEE